MKNLSLLMFCLSICQISMAQPQKCIFNEGGLQIYMVYSQVRSEKCKCKPPCPMSRKMMYHVNLCAKIVNQSEKTYYFNQIDWVVSNNYSSCTKKVRKPKTIKLTKPIVIGPKRQMLLDLNTNVKTDGNLQVVGTFKHYSDDSHILAEGTASNPYLLDPGIRVPQCEETQFFPSPQDPISKRLFEWKKIEQNCPYYIDAKFSLANIYYAEQSGADPNWAKNALGYYLKVFDFYGEKQCEAIVVWRIANLLEAAGYYEEAAYYYKIIINNNLPDNFQNTISVKKILFPEYKDYEVIDFVEESKAHLAVCLFLIKNRPAHQMKVTKTNEPVTSDGFAQMNFSDQAVLQRTNLEPIRQLATEIEKKQNYKTKDPDVKGKAIEVAMMALSWAVVPKEMKVEQRNRFIMGALGTLISLIEQDNVNVSAGSLNSGKMLADLADLEKNPAAQKAKADFNKLKAPAKTVTPRAETKQMETTSGVIISENWETRNFSGNYQVDRESGDCGFRPSGSIWKTGTHNLPTGGTFVNYPLQIIQEGNRLKVTLGHSSQQKEGTSWSKSEGEGIIENNKCLVQAIVKGGGTSTALGSLSSYSHQTEIEIEFTSDTTLQIRTIQYNGQAPSFPNCISIWSKQ